MDAAHIQANQIMERYLMGKLPLKDAQEFERYCRENPETVASLGLSDRINSALRLLDAAGEPQPWADAAPAFYQKLPVFVGVAALAAVTLIASLMLFASGQQQQRKISSLNRQLADQPLLPAQATRPITIQPSRTGPTNRAAATIGGDRAEMGDFKFDVSWSKFAYFRVTIDRVDQGRVAVLTNLARDSNGNVRVALNSSALGRGEYSVTIEGLDPRRGAAPQGWARFNVAR